MRTPLLVTLTAVLAAGCEPTTGSVTPGPDVASDRLILEVEPVDTFDIGASVSREEDGRYTGFGSVMVAFGEDYPSKLTIPALDWWQGRCGWEGSLEIASVETEDAGVVKAVGVGEGLALDVQGPGESQVRVQGTFHGGCTWWEGEHFEVGDLPVDVSITVSVVDPPSLELWRGVGCEEEGPPTLVIDGGAPTFGVSPVTDEGAVGYLSNAGPERQVRLELDLPEGMTAIATEGQGLRGVAFHGEGGSVPMIAAGEEVATLDVVPLSEVTSMDVRFVLPYADGGRHVFLEEGGGYPWHNDGVQRTLVALSAADIMVGDTRVCSSASPDWFDVTFTPEAEPYEGEVAVSGPDFTTGLWELPGPDTYTISAWAAEANGGAGLGAEITVALRQ